MSGLGLLLAIALVVGPEPAAEAPAADPTALIGAGNTSFEAGDYVGALVVWDRALNELGPEHEYLRGSLVANLAAASQGAYFATRDPAYLRYAIELIDNRRIAVVGTASANPAELADLDNRRRQLADLLAQSEAWGERSPEPAAASPEVGLEEAVARELEELRLAKLAEERELEQRARRDQAGKKVMAVGGVIMGLAAVAGIVSAGIALDLAGRRSDPRFENYDTTPIGDAQGTALYGLGISSLVVLGGATLVIAGGIARASSRKRTTAWVAPSLTGDRVGLSVGGRF